MTDLAQAYLGIVERVTALVASATAGNPSGADLAVPACPQWTLHDVLAHLAGASDDIKSGQLDGAGSPAWTQAQVDARRHQRIPALLTQWRESAPATAALLNAVPRSGGQALMDALTHELDLREALDQPLVGQEDTVAAALGWAQYRFEKNAAQLGVGPIPWERTSPVEVLRMMTGRRSRSQVAAALQLAPAELEQLWPAFTWAVFTPPQD